LLYITFDKPTNMKYTRFFAVILLSSIICTNALADVLYWKADIIPPPATIYYHGAMMKPAVKISATCLDTNANGCEFSSLIPGQFVTYEVRLIPQALLSQALNYDNWKNPLYSLNFLGISRTLPASAIMNVQTGEGFVLPQASDLQGANALDFYLPIPPTVTPGDYALAVWVAPAAGEIDTTSSLPVSDNLKITPTRPIKAPLNGALTHSGFNFPEFDPTTFRWNTGEAPLSAYPLNILPSAMTGPDQFYDPAYYVSTSGVPAWMSTTVAPSYLPPLLYFNSSLPKDPTCLLCIWLTLSPQTLAPGIYKNYIDFDHYFFPQVHLARPIWLAVDQPHLKGGESMTGQISSSTDVDEAVFDMLFEERMFFHLPFTSAGLKLKLAVKDLDGTVLYETESQPAPIVGGTGLVQATPTSRNPFIAPYTGTYQVQISAVTGTGPFKIGTKRALFRANEVLHSVDGCPRERLDTLGWPS
jgi:hypothetical protein